MTPLVATWTLIAAVFTNHDATSNSSPRQIVPYMERGFATEAACKSREAEYKHFEKLKGGKWNTIKVDSECFKVEPVE